MFTAAAAYFRYGRLYGTERQGSDANSNKGFEECDRDIVSEDAEPA